MLVSNYFMSPDNGDQQGTDIFLSHIIIGDGNFDILLRLYW